MVVVVVLQHFPDLILNIGYDASMSLDICVMNYSCPFIVFQRDF